MDSLSFTAIDFETASGLIPCEVGICVVENGRISYERSLLIKPYCFPYMSYHHQKVHGITLQDLEYARTFDLLWDELLPYIDGQILVAHNAGFDMGVLKTALDLYDFGYPRTGYLCSLKTARRTWKGLKAYNLKALCDRLDINVYHHQAGSDAKACAKIMLHAADVLQVSSLNELSERLKIPVETFA